MAAEESAITPLITNDAHVKSADDDTILSFNQHVYVRSFFLVLAQLMFFVLGAGFYTFPMWLNFILPDYLSLSRAELSVRKLCFFD